MRSVRRVSAAGAAGPCRVNRHRAGHGGKVEQRDPAELGLEQDVGVQLLRVGRVDSAGLHGRAAAAAGTASVARRPSPSSPAVLIAIGSLRYRLIL